MAARATHDIVLEIGFIRRRFDNQCRAHGSAALTYDEAVVGLQGNGAIKLDGGFAGFLVDFFRKQPAPSARTEMHADFKILPKAVSFAFEQTKAHPKFLDERQRPWR